MNHKKRLLKTMSCALTLAVACSCGAADEKQTQAPTLPKTESLPSYLENIETTAPETSAENLELSEEPSFEFSEAQKMIEDFFLGVWENESNERFKIGITEESDCRDFFDGHGLLWDAQLTDTSAVIVCRNFISERFRIVIDFCDPDVLLFYDNDEEKADSDCTKKYTRVDRASMYPDTGIMNSYLMSMLYHCYGYIELSTEIESLSTASEYFNGINAGKELTVLVSHGNKQIVFASSFVPLANQDEEEKITYIRYTKIKNEGEWILGDWSYVDYRAIEKMIQETATDPIETQDDFSDVLEQLPSAKRFDLIAERAFHTEIKNDMEMEEIISHLMDREIICSHTYELRTLFDWDFDEWFEYQDHTYYKMQHRFFNTLSEMEDFVRGTFTHEMAESWISTSSSDYGSTYTPRFIQKEDGIYFCIPDWVVIPAPIAFFLDNCTIEIKEQSETECVFSYIANVDVERYNQMCEAQGIATWVESDFYCTLKIILEDGEWKIDAYLH